MSKNALEICLKCRETLALSAKRLKCDKLLCGNVCHLYCTGLTEEQLQILKIIPNIQWHCELCLEREQNSLEQCVRQHEKRLQMLEEGLGAKLNDPTQPPLLCPYMPSTISRKAITLTVIFVLLTSILGVILATTTNIFGKTLNKSKLGDGDDSRQNIPINSTIANLDVIDNGTLVLMNVTDWGGKPPRKELDPLNLPVQRVIISHTAAEDCESKDLCSDRVRVVQFFHRDGWGWDDIGYNFLIGGDGRVYVGRGWDKQGAHTKGYNTNGIGISFIGTFTTIKPPERQLKACQLLLEEGVRLKKLMPDFRLYGHRQLSATESPGEQLYKIIQTWPHWSHQI